MKRTELKRKPPKPKKCSECPAVFQPQKAAQPVCSPGCALARVRRLKASKQQAEERKAEKAKRKELRARKEAIKGTRELTKEAQSAFNNYIRVRDRGRVCASCGAYPKQKYGGTMDCSHYRSVGSSPHLRFNVFNASSACVKCNRYLSGNIVALRQGMAARFGEEVMARIDNNNAPKNYSRSDLIRIKKIFRKKARILEKLRRRHE